MSKNNILPDQLHIEQIRKKLWSNSQIGQVSIMVGAGFSLNADEISDNGQRFLLWNELISTMKNDLYPYNENNINSATSEALKLASEYELVFGRQALDELLLKSLPDNNYIPGELHKMLMELPWADVYTTNYDTLLERAASHVYDRKYSLVMTPMDIAASSRPRIVKLHGSFPSHRPFIISEEDYRTYPNKFSSFINMVRQSIMENILCLIGFSGDDPNFLNWIGWVKDSIGKNSNQIYFIGFVNQSQRRILEARGIIPIDLSPLFPEEKYHGNDRYKKSLEWFLLNLKYGKKSDIDEWPKLKRYNPNKVDEERNLPEVPCIDYEYSYVDDELKKLGFGEKLSKDKLLSIISEWSKVRKAYPGWIVCPKSKRKIIYDTFAYYNTLLNMEGLYIHEQLSLMYELNWRYGITLTTLTEETSQNIHRIIQSINPFENVVDENNEIIKLKEYENRLNKIDEYKNFKVDYGEIKKQWLELSFALLKFYREEFRLEDFEKLKLKLEKIVKNNNEYQAKLYYEDIMFNLSIRNENKIRMSLEEWSSINDSPEYKLKRAGILAEIGETEKAEFLAEEALNEIRKSIVPGEVDVSILSKEGWAMLLLKAIKQNNSFGKRKVEFSNEYTERWNILNQYNCNPWNEIDWMRDVLEMSNPEYEEKYITKGFDRNRITRHFSFSSTIKEQIQISYSFLRMLENIGIPHKFEYISMFKKAAINAAKWTSKYSQSWALSTIIRCDEKDALDFIMSKEKLYMVNDDIINNYLKVFTQSLSYAIDNEPIKGYNYIFYITQIKNLSEIVSRLTIRLNDAQIDEVYNITLKMYKSLRIQRDFRLNDALITLIQRLFDNMTDGMKIGKLKELLHVDNELEGQYKLNSQNYKVHIFDYIEFKNTSSNIDVLRNEIESLVKDNLELLKSDDVSIRDRSLTRLLILYKNNLLSNNNKEYLGEILWSKIDKETGFPETNKFYNNVYIDLPRPKDIEINDLFLEYMRNNNFRELYSINMDKDGNKSVSRSSYNRNDRYINDCIRYIYNLYKDNDTMYIKLTYENTRTLLKKVKDKWNSQKDEFTNKFKNDVFEDEKIYIRHIIELLSLSIIPYITKENDEEISTIKVILDEIENAGYSVVYALPAVLRLGLVNEDELKIKIEASIRSNNEAYVIAGISSIYYWMLINRANGETEKNNTLIDILINSMYYEIDNVLRNIINIMISAVEYKLFNLDESLIKRLNINLKSMFVNQVNIKKHQISIEDIDKCYYFSKISKCIYDELEEDKDEIYETLEEWKKYSLNNPLREIRNIWLDK